MTFFVSSVALALLTVGLLAWVVIRVSRCSALWALLAVGGIAYFGAQWIVRIIDGFSLVI